MSFEHLRLAEPITRALKLKGYEQPTDVQKICIPEIFAGKDINAHAQTGTGKTAAFALPLIQKFNKYPPIAPKKVHALILVPTRELAVQVEQNIKFYSQFLSIKSAVIFGGQRVNAQTKALAKGVHILVATVGRLLDMQKKGLIELDQVDHVVLDESDRMLEMGFQHDLEKLLKLVPAKRQTMMFSATHNPKVKELSYQWLKSAINVNTKEQNKVATNVEQYLHPVDADRKQDLLVKLIKDNDWSQLLIFVKSRAYADELSDYLYDREHGLGLRAASIHSDKTQSKRNDLLKKFKAGTIRILVATDVAARGLDIAELPAVINFDLPHIKEDYIHRIGRTGRADNKGVAISLVCSGEIDTLHRIEAMLELPIRRVPVPEFRPKVILGLSSIRNRKQLDFDKDAKLPKDANPYANALSKRAASHTKRNH